MLFPTTTIDMGTVRIRVVGADGVYRGGFYRDQLGIPHRWSGRTDSSRAEAMICDGDPASGVWRLLEYRLPRVIEGSEANDSLIDEGAKCCTRTVPQALLWFLGQAFGPPPALVERARKFAADWSEFRSSGFLIATLEQLCHQGSTPCDHPAFLGDRASILQLFMRLDLIGTVSGTVRSHFVDSIVSAVGVRAFVSWMDRHLNEVADFLGMPRLTADTAASFVPNPCAPTEWYRVAVQVERSYDLMRSYSGLLKRSDTGVLASNSNWTIWQIEVVMRRWLPLALPSKDPLIESVYRLIGSHEAAMSEIDGADLHQRCLERLQAIARTVHSTPRPCGALLDACREELRIWRGLLPRNWRSGVGPMHLTNEQRGHLHAPSTYWSLESDQRASWEGAAFILATGCDALCKLAIEQGMPTERVRAVIRLAQRLREFPGWSSMDNAEIDKFVREQVDLARDFEEVIEEVSLLASIKQPKVPVDPPATGAPGPGAAASSSTPRKPQGATGKRPKREVIDSVARDALLLALKAAAENGTPYIPDRKAIARTVSTQLEFSIGFTSLFATEARGGTRVHRYPRFIELWQQTNKHSTDASRHARTSRKAKASHRRRADDT